MDPNTIDIERMSRETGISVSDIEKAFKMPYKYSTIEELERASNRAVSKEERRWALAEWRKLSAAQIAKASTIDEVREAFIASPDIVSDQSEERISALVKWASLCSTLEEAIEMLYDVNTDEEIGVAFARCIDLCSTFDEVREIADKEIPAYFIKEKATIIKIARFFPKSKL